MRKRKYSAHVPKEFSWAVIGLTLIIMVQPFILPLGAARNKPRVFEQAYSPVTIMASSVPLRAGEPILEWYETLMWMKHRLPDDTIVVSWWDYGYWITVMGNKTTLADNGTSNGTQIANIGRIFMFEEAESVKILERYEHCERRPQYIAVLITFDANGYDRGYGDEGKWRWMAKIGGLDDSSFGNFTLGFDWFDTNSNGRAETEELISNAKGQNSTIYKLMAYAKHEKVASILAPTLEHFEKAYFSTGKSYGGTYVVVAVYKIKYEGNT